MLKRLGYQITSFAIIGVVGFCIDGSVLTVLSVGMGMNIFFSRFVSFSLASSSTWFLNRKYTFKQPGNTSRSREYLRYIIIQVAGALLNLGIFTWLVAARPELRAFPIIPLGVGAGFALLFNFWGARILVYQER